MGFPFYIARRYTISRSKSTAVNIITAIAALGILASTAALFIIMSAFSGLRDFSLSFTDATDPDLKLSPESGKTLLLSPQQEQQLKNLKGIAVYSKVAEERVLFYFDGKEQVAMLKGVDSLFSQVSTMPEKLAGGQWPLTETTQAVAGAGIFNKLSLGLFDYNRVLEVYVPTPGKGPIDNPEEAFNKGGLSVVGVYNINDDIDSKYVFCNLDLAQDLLSFEPNRVTSLELKMAAGANEGQVRQQLEGIFNNKVIIKNRAQLNDSLYKMLNAENLVTYLFCSLVVVLTLFCLAGALIMLILDKKENIRTLYCLGTEVKSLRKIFLYQGIFITALGTFFGMAIASALILVQQHYQLFMITDQMAYPVAFRLENVAIVLATIFILGILASFIAAGRVNKKLLENS
ncbi:FtsX-like permease family protein [Flavobacterium sp. MFBS3-15]|uniref:ABC transporter permease n=1 Tax=Flavobacterium sp. MFBS3-15 TaxID=2989816 RepID=UPI0022358001|nr:FtsX-like permease family protein [Flavobacterium sp. MFBS3-15]MCW4469959.1 FtsX-like permease family protein [Flavobacterium sp. MFBS3-15]